MKLFFTFLILGCAFFSFSQTTYTAEKFKGSLLETKTGASLIYTGEKHSFTLDFVGKVAPDENPNFFRIDDKVVQTTILAFQKKIDFENLSEETQKNNLRGFYNYEMNYVKEQLKSKKLNEKHEFITLGDKIFLFWEYTMPDNNKTVEKQCYLVTICFDQILVINAPVTTDKTIVEIKDLLIAIGKTLKLNNHTIDLEKFYNELDK